VFDEWAPQTLLPGTLGAAAWTALEQRLRPVLGDADCQTLLQEWSAQIANPLAIRERELLHQIGRGEAKVDAFLAEHGHRGPNEMDLSAPRWREQPAAVQELASRIATSPLDARDNELRQSPDERLRIALVRNGAGCLHRELSPILTEAMRLLPYREAGKHELLRAYELLRNVVVELGRRLDVGDGIHFLTLAELRGAPSTAMPDAQQEQLVSRREGHQALQQLHVPAVLEITDDFTDFGRRTSAVGTGRGFVGTAISLGQATGRVHVLNAGQSLAELPPDLVIVASTLDPGWVPFLANAAALVVEQGGMLSHVALLARQFSIPMMVVPDITRQVQEGEAIRVDADRGRVELTDRRV
jgi:pyruvate,water dikinase